MKKQGEDEKQKKEKQVVNIYTTKMKKNNRYIQRSILDLWLTHSSTFQQI